MGGTGRILIVDDHPLVREGLGLALRAGAGRPAIDSAETIAEARDLARQARDYRLVLLDLMLPDVEGFSGFLELRQILGHTPIAIISAKWDKETVGLARAMGAAGYIAKTQPLDEMVTSIDQLLRGETVFPVDSPVSDEIVDLRGRIASLSRAQMRVLLALAHGRLNKQIAGDLGVTEATIKAHMSVILRKLGVTNRTQAILALQPLLITRGGPS